MPTPSRYVCLDMVPHPGAPTGSKKRADHSSPTQPGAKAAERRGLWRTGPLTPPARAFLARSKRRGFHHEVIVEPNRDSSLLPIPVPGTKQSYLITIPDHSSFPEIDPALRATSKEGFDLLHRHAR